MPLYKLTSKRLARKEKEDLKALGELDSDASSVSSDEDSNVLSDEDDLSSDSDSDDEAASGSLALGNKRKRDLSSEDSGAESDDNEDSDEEVEARPFTLTIEEVEASPLFAPLTSEWPQFCVLCPERLLKHEVMAKVHLESNAHKRAVKRWTTRIAAGSLPSTDPREIVQEIQAKLAEAKAPKKSKASKKTSKAKAAEPESDSEADSDAENASEADDDESGDEDEEEAEGKEDDGAESDDEAPEPPTPAKSTTEGGKEGPKLNRRQRRALARAAEGKPVESSAKERRKRHLEAKRKRKAAAQNKEEKAEAKAEAKAAKKPNKKARKSLDL